MDPLHELLPWYVNRTLEPAEAARFEAHLLECAPCRDELPIIEKMRVRLQQEGEALLADHPSPVDLVAAITTPGEADDLAPEDLTPVRRHLALCATCGEEAHWVLKASWAGASPSHPATEPTQARRGEPESIASASGRGDISAASARHGIPAWAWMAAALLILAAGLPLAVWLRPAPRTMILQPTLVEPTQRAAAGSTIVAVPPEAVAVNLRFPVDLDRGEFPLHLEIRGGDGRVVHRDDSVAFGELMDGLLLILSIPRSDCPDGEYLARLVPASGRAIEYPFRVQDASVQR